MLEQPIANFQLPLAGYRLLGDIEVILQQAVAEVVRIPFVHNGQPGFWWRCNPTNPRSIVVVKPDSSRGTQPYFTKEGHYNGLVICGYQPEGYLFKPDYNRQVIEDTTGVYESLETVLQQALQHGLPTYGGRIDRSTA